MDTTTIPPEQPHARSVQPELGTARRREGRNASNGPVSIPGCVFVQKIGSGAASDVYRYRHIATRRDFAVKMSRKPLSGEDRDRLHGEMRALRALSSHPAVLTIHDAFVTPDGYGCLVLDYAANGSCRNLVGDRSMTCERTLDLGIRMAGALHAAHRLGIVHRDVKPSNILIDEHGLPVLADFGICADLYCPGSVTGHSPLWSAPEVMDGSTGGNDLSDVYSLGATLFALFTGMSPHMLARDSSHGGCDERETAFIVQTGLAAAGIQSNAAEIGRMLCKALAPCPDDRYGSMLEFERALQRIRRPYRPTRDVNEPEPKFSGHPGTVARRRRAESSRRMSSAAVLVMAVLLITLTSWKGTDRFRYGEVTDVNPSGTVNDGVGDGLTPDGAPADSFIRTTTAWRCDVNRKVPS
ncbi:serine/threonine-protein kinase [Bifidobacterium simiiventris]|uniref:serine/threonine-protein kinase n=1 Tax=Bifidobacterium simiiventris TaxID=2834434 RepID=UPI001C58E419|nr:serine/threonine-protein kinase [Bifidobacterium simiiventris]MBW3078909.1 serine/threonine protein kinase [Bifidobacterium simiiventris]